MATIEDENKERCILNILNCMTTIMKDINGADMPTLIVFRMELQRNIDMGLEVDPIITKYMKDRISGIEDPHG